MTTVSPRLIFPGRIPCLENLSYVYHDVGIPVGWSMLESTTKVDFLVFRSLLKADAYIGGYHFAQRP